MRNEKDEKPRPGGHLKKEDKDLLNKIGHGRAVNSQWIAPEDAKRLEELGAQKGDDGWLDVPRFNLSLYPVDKIPKMAQTQRGKRKVPRASDSDNEYKSGDRH